MTSLEQAIQQNKFENNQVKANINVLFTANWLYHAINLKLKPFHVTHEQFNVLRILKGSHPEPMCQKDIRSRMIAPNCNITLIVKKLVDKKLIKVKQSNADRREYQIGISDSGLKLLDNIQKIMNPTNELLTKLTAAEANQLNALLDKLRR